jgi:hypothetical protein
VAQAGPTLSVSAPQRCTGAACEPAGKRSKAAISGAAAPSSERLADTRRRSPDRYSTPTIAWGRRGSRRDSVSFEVVMLRVAPRDTGHRTAAGGELKAICTVSSPIHARPIPLRRAVALQEEWAKWPVGTSAHIAGGRPVNALDGRGRSRAISLHRAAYGFALLRLRFECFGCCTVRVRSDLPFRAKYRHAVPHHPRRRPCRQGRATCPLDPARA